MTVASIPIRSPVSARDALLGHLHAAKNIAAADHDSDADAERLGGDEIGGDALESRLVDAEAVRARQGLTGDLDDHASVNRLSHGVSALPVCGRPPLKRPTERRAQPFAVAATSAAKSLSGTLDTFAARQIAQSR